MQTVFDNGNPTPLAVPDEWTPIHDGETYCSPACGARCTRAAFDAATAQVQALVAELGEGWEQEIWENLGWHFEAKKRGAIVSVEEDGYKASMRFEMGDATDIYVAETRATPREAVDAVIDRISGHVKALQRALTAISPDR